jgi:hypothetical protein
VVNAPQPQRDEYGRIPAGLVPGWGMSHWWAEQGWTPADTAAMTMSERLEAICDYWRAVAAGWQPALPREEWVGPHHPWDPADRAP